MPLEKRRKTPEEFLRECQAEEAAATQQGHLKIILGYASGVGKTHRLLDEARRRRERGQDVIVGAMQPKVPSEVEPILRKLEVIPLMSIDGGVAVDVNAIVRRHPMVCFIDGLAYDNPPGARNPTRWQDVTDILNAGIKVVASINIQYVAELAPQIEALTGKTVTQTVPIHFIQSASEIEIVDAPLVEPIERSPAGAFDARNRQQRLSKLREMTLVLAADVVDQQLNAYLEEHGIHQQFGAHERILVCITPRSNLAEMLETARTVAERFHAELTVAYVDQPNLSPADRAALDQRLEEARRAGARIEILHGESPSAAILDFANTHGVTQLFVGHSQRSGLRSRVWGNPVDALIARSRGMDIRVFPQ
ncbi:MAG: universal stress protein [Bryobacterales bacterium]|nr:universal stress protein [Bryobacterales bacterium]MBV9401186.1 universal stress protein [Bryobacterales bacterium]